MARSFHLSLRGVTSIVVLPLMILSCGKPSSPTTLTPPTQPASPAGTASTVPPVPAQNAAPAASDQPAEVIFASGEVQGLIRGVWDELEIGEELGKGDAVKVGAASECQLRFAGLAVVSIRENTRVSIDSLALGGDGARVKLGLESGTVLSKVKKLTGTDSYAIRTDTAVGGVRGTEFGMTVTPQGGTVVTVKDGTVAVLPAAYDPDGVRSLSTETVPELEQIAKDIEASAPAVRAGQELTVTREQAARAEESFQVVRVAAAQIVQEQQVQAAAQASSATAAAAPAATVEERIKSIQAATATLPSLVSAPKTLTPAHGQTLRAIDKLPAPQTPAAAGSSPAPAVAPGALPVTPVLISVSAIPSDSAIEVGGRPVGTGRYSAEVNPGDSLAIEVEHEGYASKRLAVTAKGPASYTVRLDPMPIEASFAVGSAPLVDAVRALGDAVLAVDRQGQLSAADRQGGLIWKLATQNAPNENSSPVIAGDILYFTGAREFLVVKSRTGAVVSRTALDSTTTHLFGQRVAVTSGLGVLPTSTSLSIFDPATGATIRQIPIPEGTLMTPTITRDGRVLVVSQAGEFLVIDPVSGKVAFQVPTGAGQPIATSVLVSGTKAFFADRKGLVVCVDMDARKVLWKHPLKSRGPVGVFQDLEQSARGIFIFAQNTIYGISAADGAELFPPITGVSTPPLYRAGRLYFGTQNGTLSEADEQTGKTMKSLDLKAVATTRPQPDGPRLLLGSATGRVIIVYPDAIR